MAGDTDARDRSWTFNESLEESRRFTFAVSRLVVVRGPRDPESLAADLQRCDADLIVARWPADQTWVPAALAASGRAVLPAGSLTYWATTPDRVADFDALPGVHVKALDDLPLVEARLVLGDLIAASFEGYQNHYSANPLISPRDALDGYVEWAQSCLGRDDRLAVVLTVNGERAGAATCALHDGGAEILLAGMVPSHQGRGLYASLLSGVLAEVVARGARRLSISTQTSNIRVQRAWIRFGFEPTDAVDVAHLMRPELLAAERAARSSSG